MIEQTRDIISFNCVKGSSIDTKGDSIEGDGKENISNHSMSEAHDKSSKKTRGVRKHKSEGASQVNQDNKVSQVKQDKKVSQVKQDKKITEINQVNQLSKTKAQNDTAKKNKTVNHKTVNYKTENDKSEKTENSILLKAPSSSKKRVSFNSTVTVNEVARKTTEKFQVKDKTLILRKSFHSAVKKAKKYISMVSTKSEITLKYRRREDLETDLRAIGLKPKTYVESIVLVTGLGYKETEESVQEYFEKFCEIKKVILERNSKNLCTGKASLTLLSGINTNQEFKFNGRILRLERVKKQTINRTRVFVSHMNKNINISTFRSILKAKGFVAKNIRVDLSNGKNKGYGFVEFSTTEEAERFVNQFNFIRRDFGPESFAEHSIEKSN